jgi:hypothetical protein
MGDLVTRASKVSLEQNNGRPRFTRGCQPEIKICNMAILYIDKNGVETMVRTTEDMSGKIFQRDVCQFNKFGDIRTCFDWDTGEKIREMKNPKGNWIKVADE